MSDQANASNLKGVIYARYSSDNQREAIRRRRAMLRRRRGRRRGRCAHGEGEGMTPPRRFGAA